MSPAIAQYSILALAVFVIIGGVIGFVKGKSKASLIAGVGSGVLLAISYAITLSDVKIGLIAGLVVQVALDVVFAIRIAKTKKFMPSGMLLILCAITQVITVLGLVQIS